MESVVVGDSGVNNAASRRFGESSVSRGMRAGIVGDAEELVDATTAGADCSDVDVAAVDSGDDGVVDGCGVALTTVLCD